MRYHRLSRLMNQVVQTEKSFSGSAFARGVPALEDERALARRQFQVPLDPMALDRSAAGWNRHLLVLGGERVAAELNLQIFENRKWLAHR